MQIQSGVEKKKTALAKRLWICLYKRGFTEMKEIQIFAGIDIAGHDYYEHYRGKSIKAFLQRLSYEYEFEYGAKAIVFKLVDDVLTEVYCKTFKKERTTWYKVIDTSE